MQIDHRNFPHPVLSPFSDDLEGCQFQASVHVLTSNTSYRFEVVPKTSCRDLLDLIRAGKAGYALHVECASTRYRRLFPLADGNNEIVVESALLDGKVQLATFVVANDDISEYHSENFHPDYGSTRFQIGVGDILAVGHGLQFIAETEVDPLKQIPSIFTVQLNRDNDAPTIDLDMMGDKVVIQLRKEAFDQYKYLYQAQDLKPILANLVVFPALVSLLGSLDPSRADYTDFEELRWYRVITKRLRDLGIDLSKATGLEESPLSLAQKLVGGSLEKSLEVLGGYIEE